MGPHGCKCQTSSIKYLSKMKELNEAFIHLFYPSTKEGNLENV